MNKLIFTIKWADNAEYDFIEFNIKATNFRFSANIDCYASLEDTKKTWSEDVTSKILANENFSWELAGYESTATIECSKAHMTGLIHLKLSVTFRNEEKVTEQCVLILDVEPAQLDRFSGKMKSLPREVGYSVEL